MDTAVTSENTTTTTVATTKVRTAKAGAKLGRKATAITEITDREFTLEDLFAANPSVKQPTVRAFVSRQVRDKAYNIVKKVKSGLRGKPANVFTKV